MGTIDHLQTPQHRAGFWEDVDAGLQAEARQMAPARRPRRARRAFTLSAAAVLLAVVVAAAGLGGSDGGTSIGVADPPIQDDGPTGARAAAIRWVGALATGDMRHAWDALGPASQEAWASFEAFEDARDSFAGGLAQWAGAGVDVTVTQVRAAPRTPMYVVTFTRLDTADAVVVRETTSGYALEPFTPHDTIGLQFVGTGPQSPDEAVVVSVPDERTEVALVIDGAQDSVVPTATGGSSPHGIELGYIPAGGWAPGRHIVTAFALYADGTPAATAVTFHVS
jgi:hypothetical protein